MPLSQAAAAEERRLREEQERSELNSSREMEAAKLRPVLSDRSTTRQERERKLQGKTGCAGMLAVLRDTYGDENAACTEEVFDAVLR